MSPILDRGRSALALALVLAAGCRSATEKPAPGALLLDVHLASGAQMPDELRLSAYDDTGPLWQDARFPESGALVPRGVTELGTILLEPGATSGALRIDLRGLLGGAQVDEAALTIPAASISGGTFDVTLAASLPPDAGRDAGMPTRDAGRDAVPRDAGHDTAPRRDAGRDVVAPRDAGQDLPPAKGKGESCMGASECASGFCKDGVCCNNACNQPCNSCAPTGTCTALKSGQDDPECIAPMSCNSKGKCVAGGGS